MCKRIGIIVYTVMVFFITANLHAAGVTSGISQSVIEYAKKEYRLPPAAITRLIQSLKTLPLSEQEKKFSELAIQFHSLIGDENTPSKIKIALNRGNFNSVSSLLNKPDASQVKELAKYHYQFSVLEELKLQSSSAYQQAKEALRFDGRNALYQRQNARLLLAQKKTRLAIPFLERALQIDLNSPKKSPADLALDHRLLGMAWFTLAKGGKAAKHLQESVLFNKQTNKVRLANSYYLLAQVLQSLGDTKPAIEYYDNALKIYKSHLGNRHPAVANTLFQLATAWKVLGKEKKTALLLQQSLRSSRNVYGVGHPMLASKLNATGDIFRLLGKYDQATQLHQQALQISQSKSLNPNDMAKNYSFLGTTYLAKNNTEQAIAYFEKALQLENKVYGKKHPMLALRHGNLASAWLKKGDTDKALDNFKQALLITRHNYGNNHHEVASLLRNIGLIWQAKGNYKEAVNYFDQALTTERFVNGENSPMVTRHMNELGYALNQLGKNAKAEAYHQQALTIDKKAYGLNHATVARDYSNLGSAVANQGRTDQALGLHQQALAIDLKVSGGSHPNTSRDLTKLGHDYKKLGKLKQSVNHQEKALRIDRTTLGEEHQSIAIQENNLGVDFYSLGDDKKAKKHMNNAIKLAGEQHPSAQKIEQNMKKMEIDLKLEIPLLPK